MEGLEDSEAMKEALAKCQSKAGRLKKVIYKGAWSQPPEQRRKVVEKTLLLEKRLKGADPLAAIMKEMEGRQAEFADIEKSDPSRSNKLLRQSTLVSDDTIALSESSFIAPEKITFVDIEAHIERLEKGYLNVAAVVQNHRSTEHSGDGLSRLRSQVTSSKRSEHN